MLLISGKRFGVQTPFSWPHYPTTRLSLRDSDGLLVQCWCPSMPRWTQSTRDRERFVNWKLGITVFIYRLALPCDTSSLVGLCRPNDLDVNALKAFRYLAAE